MESGNPGAMRFRCMSRQGGSSAILQKAFFKHALVNSNNNRNRYKKYKIQVEIHPHNLLQIMTHILQKAFFKHA